MYQHHPCHFSVLEPVHLDGRHSQILRINPHFKSGVKKRNRTFQLDACVIVGGAVQARGGSAMNGRAKTRTMTHSDKKSGQRLRSCAQTGGAVHQNQTLANPASISDARAPC